MEIIENKALLINVRQPERYTALIETSKYVRQVSDDLHEIMVKWDYDNVLTLASLGIKRVPSTIYKDYKWSGRFTPMAHQKDMASFIITNPKCFVFSEMGVGKTASAAWAADYLLKHGKIKRILVVCPLSIMKPAWQKDLFSVAPHRSVGIAHGSVKTRRQIIAGKYEFVVINYDGIMTVLDELIDAKFDMVIADEATYLKATSTLRWKAFNKITKDCSRVVLMTGTPAAQSPEDAFGLARIICPERVPRYVGAWKDIVMQKITMFKWVPRPKASEIVFAALQPAIRYTKEECLDLPDIMYETRDVPMTAQQEKYYNILKKQMLVKAAGEVITAANAAVGMTKLLQLSSGCCYGDSGETIFFDVSNRLSELEAVIDESLQKVIVFAPFTHTIHLIEDYLNKKKIPCAVINGEVTSTKRAAIIESFQTDQTLRVIIIQPKAAAHGVTLTAANTIVWFGPTPSVETYLQANARAHRNGQQHKVTVIMIQGSPAEEKMYKMLNSKIEDHMKIIDLYDEVLNE